VFLEANYGPYRPEIAPSFWKWLEHATETYAIRSPMAVYRELTKAGNHLAIWIRQMRSSGLFVEADKTVQTSVGDIAAFVQSRYQEPFSKEFLRGADSWVIAHALVEQGIVVTHEVLAAENCKRVKIPNVCAHFKVRCLSVYDALQQLGMKL